MTSKTTHFSPLSLSVISKVHLLLCIKGLRHPVVFSDKKGKFTAQERRRVWKDYNHGSDTYTQSKLLLTDYPAHRRSRQTCSSEIISVGLWGFQPLQRPWPYITKPLILIVSKFANRGDLAIWKNNTVLLSSNDIHSPPRPVLWPTLIFQQSFCWSKPFLTLKVLALRVKTVNALHTG